MAADIYIRAASDFTRCPICNGTSERELLDTPGGDGRSYSVAWCGRCRIGHTVPEPEHEALQALYSTDAYRTADGKRFNRVVEWLVSLSTRARVRRFASGMPPGSVLDIGCGRGALLALLRKQGWAVTGVEFNDETASYARRVYNIDVIPSDRLRDLPGSGFDLIILHHVLEHVREPIRMVEECRRLLRPGGRLVVAVPNLDSLQARWGGNRWFHLDVPYHLYHFTTEGLLRLLQRSSFRPVAVRQFDWEQNPAGWLVTLYNRSGMRRNAFYDLLKRREIARNRATHPMREVARMLLLLPLYAPLAVMLSLVESFMLRRGGTVSVIANPENN